MPDGRVSGWASDARPRRRRRDLSQAQGVFVLPDPVPRRLLFVSGGSGMTPILSMLRHLAAIGYEGAVACMHYARREAMFAEELARWRTPRRAPCVSPCS